MHIRNKVRNFFRIQYVDGKVYDDGEVMSILPPNLKDEITSYNQRALYEKVPLFLDIAHSVPEKQLGRHSMPHLVEKWWSVLTFSL